MLIGQTVFWLTTIESDAIVTLKYPFDLCYVFAVKKQYFYVKSDLTHHNRIWRDSPGNYLEDMEGFRHSCTTFQLHM